MQGQQQKMQYRPLGSTGLFVSELCLGAMTFSTTGKGAWGLPAATEEESHKMLDAFVARGGNFIDTADVYGDSEEAVGHWLAKQNRSDLIIATKVRNLVPNYGINDQGLSRKHILDAVDNSLKRLGTHYIDLYQCHCPDISTSFKETFRTLNDLVRIGKVRYVGVSNFSGWQLQKAVDLCNYMGLEPIVSIQQQYSLLERHLEWDVLDVCKHEGVGILPWSPLKGGWLTGKFKRGMEKPEEGRVAWAQNVGWEETGWDSLNNDVTWNTLDVLAEVANETGRSQAQVALRWLLQKPQVTAPIIGARTTKHLEDNLAATEFTLSEEQMAKLDKASHAAAPYPWKMHWNTVRTVQRK